MTIFRVASAISHLKIKSKALSLLPLQSSTEKIQHKAAIYLPVQYQAFGTIKKLEPRFRPRALRVASPPTEQSQLGMSGEKKSKRKLGLVIGYLGTAYRGLQINREHAGLPTVEQVLEEAMFKAGLIRESNFGDLDKIGWSRSSRTDKGVHAARLLVCGKLLVNLDDFDELGLSQTVSETINAHLPIDIRVFSCAKVPGAFRPRESCSYREYEYWLPARYFSTSPPDSCPVHSVEESLEIFKEVVRSFEGTHSFHNFQGSRSKEMRKKKASDEETEGRRGRRGQPNRRRRGRKR